MRGFRTHSGKRGIRLQVFDQIPVSGDISELMNLIDCCGRQVCAQLADVTEAAVPLLWC